MYKLNELLSTYKPLVSYSGQISKHGRQYMALCLAHEVASTYHQKSLQFAWDLDYLATILYKKLFTKEFARSLDYTMFVFPPSFAIDERYQYSLQRSDELIHSFSANSNIDLLSEEFGLNNRAITSSFSRVIHAFMTELTEWGTSESCFA